MTKRQRYKFASIFVDFLGIFMTADLAYQLLEANVSGTEMFWKIFFMIIMMSIMESCVDKIILWHIQHEH